MPRVSDLLYRFRPSGAPGSATKAGVPADRARDAAEELEPVFAALAPTLAECRRLVEEGRAGAARIRARDAAAVQQLLATSAPRSAAERAKAVAAQRGGVSADTELVDIDTEDQVAHLRERLRRLLPAYRDDVAASVRALLTEGTPEGTEGAP